MNPPLRRVTKRRRNRSELLECGHDHPGSYRKAQRRRCSACGEQKTDPKLDVIIERHCQDEAQEPYIPNLEPSSGPRCAYCLDSGDLYTCPGCQTRLHKDCREELRRCPTIGCIGPATLTLVVATPRQIVVSIPSKSFPKRCWAMVVAMFTWIIGKLLRRR